MSIRAKKWATFLLALCMLLSAPCLFPVKAAAETAIEKVLVTTSYTPVALMEVRFITAATSTEGCSVSSITWYDQNYQPETVAFGTDTYHLEIRLDAAEGYTFSEGILAYLNNAGVDVTRDESGAFIVIKRDYTPAIWAPTIIKHPGGETVTEGGWASFVATATYTSGYTWSVMDPSGRSLACADIASKFPGVTVEGDGSGKIIIYNIPLEMDGWKAVCAFSGPGGSVTSNGALITVKADPAKATPSPSPSPSPEPTPSPSPEAHEHEFGGNWDSDENEHWQSCVCGEKGNRAKHSFEWTEISPATREAPGEEKGVCAVCGYETSRETAFDGEAENGGVSFGAFKAILFSILALIAAGLVLMVIQSARERKRRRRRRK